MALHNNAHGGHVRKAYETDCGDGVEIVILVFLMKLDLLVMNLALNLTIQNYR